jgi:hypothetical protein
MWFLFVRFWCRERPVWNHVLLRNRLESQALPAAFTGEFSRFFFFNPFPVVGVILACSHFKGNVSRDKCRPLFRITREAGLMISKIIKPHVIFYKKKLK